MVYIGKGITGPIDNLQWQANYYKINIRDNQPSEDHENPGHGFTTYRFLPFEDNYVDRVEGVWLPESWTTTDALRYLAKHYKG